jgi:hypothetical protein
MTFVLTSSPAPAADESGFVSPTTAEASTDETTHLRPLSRSCGRPGRNPLPSSFVLAPRASPSDETPGLPPGPFQEDGIQPAPFPAAFPRPIPAGKSARTVHLCAHLRIPAASPGRASRRKTSYAGSSPPGTSSVLKRPDTPWEVVGPAQRPAEPDGVPGLSKVVSKVSKVGIPDPKLRAAYILLHPSSRSIRLADRITCCTAGPASGEVPGKSAVPPPGRDIVAPE